MAKQVDLSSLTKKQLQEYIRKEMKKVNRSIALLQRETETNMSESAFLKQSLNQFRTATKTKSKRKVATGNLSRFSKKQLIDLANLQRQYLSNPRSTAKGRKAIFEKQFATLQKSQPEITRKQLKNFQKVMAEKSEAISTIISARYLGSEQLIEISKKYTAEEIVDFSDKMMSSLGSDKIGKIPDANFNDFVQEGLARKISADDMSDYYDSFLKRIKPTKFSF